MATDQGQKETSEEGIVPEVGDCSKLPVAELPNPYETIPTATGAERMDLPKDPIRHYCDRACTTGMEPIARESKPPLGTKALTFRENASLTQDSPARTAGRGHTTMIRLENEKSAQKLCTLKAIAQALERPEGKQ